MLNHEALEREGWKQKSLSGFIQHAGPLWVRSETAGWAYGFEIGPQHLNPAGVAHGGALATLMDHAISTVAWETCERTPCVTLQLDSHFVNPARLGQFIQARASVLQSTGSLLFLRGELHADGVLVLAAQALMRKLTRAEAKPLSPDSAT